MVSLVPSEKTTRSLRWRALRIIPRSVSRPVPRRTVRLSWYALLSRGRRATPSSIACRATAADSRTRIRGSMGLGSRYSGPKVKRSFP